MFKSFGSNGYPVLSLIRIQTCFEEEQCLAAQVISCLIESAALDSSPMRGDLRRFLRVGTAERWAGTHQGRLQLFKGIFII
jgi:hypothetical protein